MKTSVRRIIQIAICGMLMLSTSACEDFLTKKDPSNFNDGNYYTLPGHAESAVTAIYADLSQIMSSAWMMTEFQTGTANTELGDPPNYLIRNLSNSADNSYSKVYWDSHYRGIANANVAINRIPGIEMDLERKEKLIGQAKFLRAYYYFNLVRIFGEVPLIEESINLASENLYPSKASLEAIYALIVKDLLDAEASGLPFKDESGRVSLGAVKSLLSTVYLTMAGFPLKKGVEYYRLSANKSREVIASNQFHLFPDYKSLHDKSTDNKGEHIFMIQFNELDQPSNALQSAIVPYKRNISLFSSEIGAIYAQKEFIDSYDPEDKRIREKEFFYTNFTLVADRSKSINLGGHFIYKFFDYEAHTSKIRSGLNWSVIRYADVLLNYAEATNELSGPSNETFSAVNQIRKRAELPDLANLSQAQFRDAIWIERMHELCFENKVWFDMARTRKAYNFSTKTFNEYVGHKFSYGPTLTERELLFPIPSAEIRNNPKLKQNIGY
jgi:hypothetical protein